MKPGIKTSEFWVILIGAILTAYAELSGADIDAGGLAAIWAGPAAYTVSRGLAKFGGK